MRCPTLAELPAPPAGKTGWPWTVETPQLPDRQHDGQAWPRVSIVTPSFNQGRYIEETIRSVLLQGYPDLEYVVMDGGSTDESLEVIERYAPWLAHWESAPDRGQAHAINKGLDRASGAIHAYLNSDDYYLPGALNSVGASFARSPWDIFVGRSWLPEVGRRFGRNWWRRRLKHLTFPMLITATTRYELTQESLLWRAAHAGHRRFDESYHFCLDVEWFARLFQGANVAVSSVHIGHFRQHEESKSRRLHQVCIEEHARLNIVERPHVPELAVARISHRWRLANLAAILMALGGRSLVFKYHHP